MLISRNAEGVEMARKRLGTPALERIERYFEDYKSQINNRQAGIDQPTKGEER